MKSFYLSIKSGVDDVPDIDEVVQAKSKERAIEFFYARYNEFGRDIIARNTYAEDEMAS